MAEPRRDPPAADEIEVSVFGPGYGECIVVHLGGDRWISVDSCLDRETKRPAALAYLEEMGVDPGRRVEMIISTHWHDDHIRGIAATLAACPAARFVCSSSLRETAFFELVALGETIRGPHGGGVNEFTRILQQIQKRRAREEPAPIETCHAGSVLLDDKETSLPLKIESLSPSDADHRRMSAAFAAKKDELLSGAFKKTVPSIHPNLGSVVLRIRIGGRTILLGADMEHRSSSDGGWKAILSESPRELHADLYKIAHHGSETGDTPGIWSELLVPSCPAALAPNHRLSTPLPRSTDVARILTHTSEAFATAPAITRRKRLEQPAERLLRHKGILIHEIPASQGHVRARVLVGTGDRWSIDTYGRAHRLGG